jgi:hypothetical protein
MSDLGYLETRPFLKLSRGGASIVRRRTSGGGMSGLIDPDGLYGLGGLGGEAASPCGTAPELQAGEKAQCCTNVGWVVFSPGENPYGLCERAAAAAGVAAAQDSGGSGATSSDQLPSDPMARVAERQRRLDERRSASDEQRFEQQKQEIQLRFIAGRMQAITATENARLQAIAAAESARLRAAAEERRNKAAAEKTKQLLIVGVLGLAAAKVAGLF